MARAQLNYLVTTSIGTTVQIANAATVTVRKASDNSLATLYTGSTGGSTVANPLVVNAFGRVSAWVDINKYLLVIEGVALTSYSEYWEAVPADHLATYGKGSIVHGSNSSVARPEGFLSVEWIGSVAPANAGGLDTWVNTASIAELSTLFFGAMEAVLGGAGSYRSPHSSKIISASLRCVTAPVGSALTVQILKGATVIATLSIAAGTTTEDTEDLDVNLVEDDLININCTSAGSTTPAGQVSLQIDTVTM